MVVRCRAVLGLALVWSALGAGGVAAQTGPALRYDPYDTAYALLNEGFTKAEMPGIDLIDVASEEPAWDGVLYEIRAWGDLGVITYDIYPSRAAAADNPIFAMGMEIEIDDQPQRPAAVVRSDGWSDFAFACAQARNVLVCGSSSPSYLSLTGYDPLPDGAALLLAERGLARLTRVANAAGG